MDIADLRIHHSLFGLQKCLISNNGQGLDIMIHRLHALVENKINEKIQDFS